MTSDKKVEYYSAKPGVLMRILQCGGAMFQYLMDNFLKATCNLFARPSCQVPVFILPIERGNISSFSKKQNKIARINNCQTGNFA